MDKTRLWIIGSVLVMVIVGALGWIVGIQPQLDQATAANAQTSQVESANTVKATILAKMKKDSENLPSLKQKLSELTASVPAQADWPTFSDEMSGFAAAAGVTVIASTAGEGKAYAPPQADGAPAAAGASTGSSSGTGATPTPTPSAPPTPAPAPTPAAGAPPVTTDLIDASNFTVIPVSVTVRGTEDQIFAFIASAQAGKRLFLVNALNIDTAQSGPGAFDAKVSGYIYVLNTGTGGKTSK